MGKKIRNILVIFLISGLWHGANWTFICWGLLNALYIMPSVIFRTNRNNLDVVAKGRVWPSVREFLSMVVTFGLTVFAWIFFRADSLGSAFRFIGKLFSRSLFTVPDDLPRGSFFLTIVLFFMLEWMGREQPYAIAGFGMKWPKAIRWLAYYAISVFVIYMCFSTGKPQPFIYFQF
jgi:alginate O-acetyltransferase complex protein AlgI